ncbi:MAG: insulinase family protein [Flavobacteriales bacterium]|nr:insulinase family protein [Flavobacteriales bacterium]MDW8409877.1 insulinase family protein [Flavobacteriales bacterium]
MIIRPPLELIQDLNIDAGRLVAGTSVPVVLFPATGSTAVRVVFLLNAGYLDDTLPEESSLLFQILDKAHPQLPALEFQGQLEELGAHLQASAESLYSEVVVECCSQNLKNVLKLVKEVLLHYKAKPEELSLQQNILERHLAFQLARPASLIAYHLRAWKYGDFFPGVRVPYPQEVHSIVASLLEQHWHRIFPHKLSAVCICGDIPPDFEPAWLSPLPSQPPPVQPLKFLLNSQSTKGPITVCTEHGEQVALRLVRRLPVLDDLREITALRVAVTLLGGFFGSRLMRTLREKEGLTYGIHARLSRFPDIQFLEISTEVDTSRYQEALNLIWKEMETLTILPPDPLEITEVKNYMAGRIISAYDGTFRNADRWIARHKAKISESEEIDYIKTLASITLEDVQKAAAKWLNPEHFTLLHTVHAK